MEIKEIRAKETPELKELLKEWQKKFETLKFKATQGQLKNIRELRIIKKDIARVMLALGEKVKNQK